MHEHVERGTYTQRLAVTLLAILGGMALLLAAIGLYAVMSYAVSQNRRELALRMALGAQATDLLRLVMSRGLILTASGIMIGTSAAAILGRRVNRPWALVIGMTGSGLSCVALGYATNLIMFAGDVFAYWIFCMFLYSYWLGTAALLDPGGRIGTLGGGLEKLGVGAGVFAAGVLAKHTTYSSTGLLGFGSCLLGLTLGFPSLFRALRRNNKAALSALSTVTP